MFSTMFDHYFGEDAAHHQEPQKAWLTLPAGKANLERLHAVG